MILTKNQEKEFFNRINKGDESAREELVETNLFLIGKIAEKYKENNKNLSQEQLIEIGKRGLEKAIGKYDMNKSYKFSTYATWWIRQAIHIELGIEE